jgi:hypothetical protein
MDAPPVVLTKLTPLGRGYIPVPNCFGLLPKREHAGRRPTRTTTRGQRSRPGDGVTWMRNTFLRRPRWTPRTRKSCPKLHRSWSHLLRRAVMTRSQGGMGGGLSTSCSRGQSGLRLARKRRRLSGWLGLDELGKVALGERRLVRGFWSWHRGGRL